MTLYQMGKLLEQHQRVQEAQRREIERATSR